MIGAFKPIQRRLTMEFDTSEFESTLLTESRKVFKEIMCNHHDIYVIGFYHSGGWDTIWPIFNSQRQVESLSLATDNEEEFLLNCNLKWNPYDFPEIELYSSCLPKSEKALQALRQHFPIPYDSNKLQCFWKKTLTAMEAVLKQLQQEGIFNLPDKTSPIVYIANQDESFEDRFDFIIRLNSHEKVHSVKEEFEKIIKLQKKWWDNAFQELMAEQEKNK